jgi:hypothetical protein
MRLPALKSRLVEVVLGVRKLPHRANCVVKTGKPNLRQVNGGFRLDPVTTPYHSDLFAALNQYHGQQPSRICLAVIDVAYFASTSCSCPMMLTTLFAIP